MAGRRGDVARVLRLANEELAHGVFERQAVARAAVGFLALRDDLRERNFDLFLELLVLLFRVASRSMSSRFSRDRHDVSLSSENSSGDRALGLCDVLHQPAEGRVLLVERELFDDDRSLFGCPCRRRRDWW